MKTKKYLFAALSMALLASCSEDFGEWAGPQGFSQEDAVNITVSATSDYSSIVMADMADESIPLINMSYDMPETASLDELTLAVKATTPDGSEVKSSIPVTNEGVVSKDDLADVVSSIFGKRPVERSLVLTPVAYIYTDADMTSRVRAVANDIVLSVTPEAPAIEGSYYLTGSLNGWDNTNTDYRLTNDGSDPYENPTFTCRIAAPAEGGAIEFKMTPESGLGGDWSGCLAAGTTDGTFVYNNAGGNLYIAPVEGAKFYDLTFNMLDLTWSYKAITFSDYVYLAGDFNGWSDSASPLVHLGDGTYEGFYYILQADESTTWGFKFVIDGKWSGGGHDVATSGSFTLDGGGNLNCETGFYQVKVDLASSQWSLTKVNTISLIGSAVNGDSSWGTDADMTFSTADKCWVYEGPLTAGEFKFRMNHDWTISWGSDNTDYLTNANGANLKMAEAGNYKVMFWPNCNGQGVYTVTAAN